MPILKPEPDLHPPDLFGLSLEEKPWWIGRVRSRQEKLLARHLRPTPIPFYLPLHEKRVRRDGRTFTSFIPLFPGYVFFRGTFRERLEAFRTSLLVYTIEIVDQRRLNDELLSIRRLQELGLPIVPYPFLRAGDAVRVVDGPFKGYRGVVLREKGALRLVVSVSTLRRSIAVELQREELCPESRAA